jgi:hypothetical protein
MCKMAEYRSKTGGLFVITGKHRKAHSNRAWGFYTCVAYRELTSDGACVRAGAMAAGTFHAMVKPTGRSWTVDRGKHVLLPSPEELKRAAEGRAAQERRDQLRAEEAADP